MSVFKYHAFIFFMRPPRWRTEQGRLVMRRFDSGTVWAVGPLVSEIFRDGMFWKWDASCRTFMTQKPRCCLILESSYKSQNPVILSFSPLPQELVLVYMLDPPLVTDPNELYQCLTVLNLASYEVKYCGFLEVSQGVPFFRWWDQLVEAPKHGYWYCWLQGLICGEVHIQF